MIISRQFLGGEMSPPTRGAWIEIISMAQLVGRGVSPPTRGAWIEISAFYHGNEDGTVAPHTGGVD